jgi:hypothetical protein
MIAGYPTSILATRTVLEYSYVAPATRVFQIPVLVLANSSTVERVIVLLE